MMTIFISYNRQSETTVRTLADDIKTLGYSVWFDQDLTGGQMWWDRILLTIRRCDVFIFVLNTESLNSMACKRELLYAADLCKPILPVLISEGVSTNLLPPQLSQIQFVDFRKQDRDAAFRLARALSTVPPPKPLPDPLPDPPEVPISYLGSLTGQVETSSNLTYTEQSALLVDLKRGLRDLETADDARTLLERLRKRRDLFARIAEEIDELLNTTRKTSLDEAESPIAKKHSKPHSQKKQPAPSATREDNDRGKVMFGQEEKSSRHSVEELFVVSSLEELNNVCGGGAALLFTFKAEPLLGNMFVMGVFEHKVVPQVKALLRTSGAVMCFGNLQKGLFSQASELARQLKRTNNCFEGCFLFQGGRIRDSRKVASGFPGEEYVKAATELISNLG